MIKTLIALRHMCVKKFGVEFIHEKVSRDLGSGFVINFSYVGINKNNRRNSYDFDLCIYDAQQSSRNCKI